MIVVCTAVNVSSATVGKKIANDATATMMTAAGQNTQRARGRGARGSAAGVGVLSVIVPG